MGTSRWGGGDDDDDDVTETRAAQWSGSIMLHLESTSRLPPGCFVCLAAEPEDVYFPIRNCSRHAVALGKFALSVAGGKF